MNSPATNAAPQISRQSLPVRHAAVKRADRQQQHQRIHGQQIARKQRAAQHAEEQRVRPEAAEKCAAARSRSMPARSWPSASGRGVSSSAAERHQHRHKEIHVRGEMQNAMPEGRQNAQRRKRGLGVVAQELGIAEEKAGLRVVVGVPRRQRQNAARRATPPRARAARAPERPAANPSTRLIAASVSGMAIAVSLHSAAAENHSAAAQRIAPARRQRVRPVPTASTRRQKCPHAPASSAQTRWDRGR